jgi:hypothetical protein
MSGRMENRMCITATPVNKPSMHGDAFGRDVCLVKGGGKWDTPGMTRVAYEHLPLFHLSVTLERSG